MPPAAIGRVVCGTGLTGAAVGARGVRPYVTPHTRPTGTVRVAALRTGITGPAVEVIESSQAIRAIPTGAIGGHVGVASLTETAVSVDQALPTGSASAAYLLLIVEIIPPGIIAMNTK